MSVQTKPRLLLIAALAALAVPVGGAMAAPPGHAADTATATAVGRVMAPTDAAPVRVADNDDDDDHGWRRAGGGLDRQAMRRGSDDDDHDQDDHDDDDDDDDDDDMGDGRAAPRRIGPAPAQNPLIGAPRAAVN